MLRILSGRPLPAKLGQWIDEINLLWRIQCTSSFIGYARLLRSDWIAFLDYRFGYPSTRKEPPVTSMTTFPSSSVRSVGTRWRASTDSVPAVGWP